MMTNFQSRCIQKFRDLFEELPKVRYDQFEEIIGKRETYFKAVVKKKKKVVEIYIYKDEAGYMLEQEWNIFEKADYASEEELLQQFLAALRKALVSPAS